MGAPFLAMLLPRRIGLPESLYSDVALLVLCALVSLAIAVRIAKLEPVAPPKGELSGP